MGGKQGVASHAAQIEKAWVEREWV
ncbi:uncharacterized protein G2W53_005989 [Senna tora]|uniref:Uncharacterized protein n=1 Tax=Senna tora TaxID=362788 RepID=A0A834X4I5_9FABA|nr:uncharacterized protein G2W53_005989 [Senna tora]